LKVPLEVLNLKPDHTAVLRDKRGGVMIRLRLIKGAAVTGWLIGAILLPVTNLNDAGVQCQSEAQLNKILAKGKAKMPGYE